MALDKEQQKSVEEKSFAEMMAQGVETGERFQPGDQVEARVVRISGEWIFLDLGGKSEGILKKAELLDSEGRLTVKEGDLIRAYFLSVEKAEPLFTTRLGDGAALQAHLEEAFRSAIPVEGTVEKEIKGGFEVKIAGNARGFCPYSQMELRRVTNPEHYIGQQFTFRISEYRERGRNLILSRRALLEEERQQQREALRGQLQEGMTVKGTITSLREFGAFVDVGGIEGLIPLSEISWGRVEDIRGLLHEGQEVEVAVLKLDWDKDRFTFSLKETLPDPWEQAAAKYPEGATLTGRVARLVDFGAFVTLEPGIDGLVHISQLGAGRKINHPREVVEEGQILEVRVNSVDPEKKRISLSLPGAETARKPGTGPRKKEERPEGDYRRYLEKGGKGKPMGTLGDLLQSKLKETKKK